MGVVKPLALLALVAILPLAVSQPLPTPPVGSILDPVLDPVVATVLPQAENATGEDLHGEEVAAAVVLDIRNADDDVVGILFGGGKVGADANAQMHLEFRAVGTPRLDEALRSFSGDANVTLQHTFGIPVNRTALTAEEIRVVGGGALLQAFQASELAAAKAYLQHSLPGLTVLDLSGAWQNTLPLADERSGKLPGIPDYNDPRAVLGSPPVPRLREPPLVLDASARLQYVDRISLYGLLQAAGHRSHGPQDDLQRRIEANQTDAFADRSAFRILGINQLLDFQVPPGWRLNLTLHVPQGFTIEGATDELSVSADHRTVTYQLDGEGRSSALAHAGVVALSNRFLVTVTVLAATLLAGYLIRLPIELSIMSTSYLLHRRAGGRLHRAPLAQRVASRFGLVRPPPPPRKIL